MTDGDMTEGSAVVLRQDRAGRVRRSAAQRAEILGEFDRSGLSGPQFARVSGLSYQTLATWLKKRRDGALESVEREAGPPALFVRAVADNAGMGSTSLELRFAGGASVTITTPQQARLAAVLVGEMRGGMPGC